jgi:tRNA pseudouridine55 synthase
VSGGVLLVAKPEGVTSHDVVALVRRRLSEERGTRVKVGHAGTLDPFATGLLLVLVGRATRVQRFLMGLAKTYRAVARLGFRSDTGDRDGRIEPGRTPAEPLALPTGELLQRPPAYSAVRVDGERLYARARRGDAVEGAPRAVRVHRFEHLWRAGDRVGLEIECSAGTYVRQLVAGLDDAYCETLERTRIGPFRLEDAAGPEEGGTLLPLAEALAFLPERPLMGDEAERARHGVGVPVTPATAHERGAALTDAPRHAIDAVRMTFAGELVAVGEPRGEVLRPTVVFSA